MFSSSSFTVLYLSLLIHYRLSFVYGGSNFSLLHVALGFCNAIY